MLQSLWIVLFSGVLGKRFRDGSAAAVGGRSCDLCDAAAVAGEHREAGASPWWSGHAVSWLLGAGALLRSVWSHSLTKAKTFWFSGCCSLVSLQRAPPRSAAWSGLEVVLAVLSRQRFFNKGMCAHSVVIFCVALSLKLCIFFTWCPWEYCKICVWRWVPTHRSHSFGPTWPSLRIYHLSLQLCYAQSHPVSLWGWCYMLKASHWIKWHWQTRRLKLDYRAVPPLMRYCWPCLQMHRLQECRLMLQ